MAQIISPAGRSARRAAVVAAAMLGAFLVGAWLQRRPLEAIPEKPLDNLRASSPVASVVSFSAEKQSASGIQVQPAAVGVFAETLEVPGKLAINEDRIAHLSPMVEGIVREVKVQLGQTVAAGDVLAILDSREVGQARLELVKSRLQVGFSASASDWNATIHKNTQGLIAAIVAKIPVLKIEDQFKDQAMGDFRQQLIVAYAKSIQSRADVDRLEGLQNQGITAAKDLILARAVHEAAVATLEALLEQIKFSARQQALRAEQQLREAQTAQTICESNLMMMGFSKPETLRMDPLQDDANVSLYPLRAPFAGTVIEKHLVLSERVGPSMQVLQIADLSSVWIKADVYEKDVPATIGLKGRTIGFRVAALGEKQFEASVLYAGDVVDETTRTAHLVAVARNPDGVLKPGVFVTASLPARTQTGVLLLPAAAVQRDQGRTFVFVQRGKDSFEARPIMLGMTTSQQVEVRSGLQAGEKVVVRGGFALKSEMLADLLAE